MNWIDFEVTGLYGTLGIVKAWVQRSGSQTVFLAKAYRSVVHRQESSSCIELLIITVDSFPHC